MDEPATWLPPALFVLFGLVGATAAAALASLSALSRARLRLLLQEGASRSQGVQRAAVEEPAAILAASVVVHTLAMAGAAASGLLVVLQQWSYAPWAGVVAALALLAVLLVLQLLARALAVRRPERAVALFLGPLRLLSVPLSPLVALARETDRVVHKLLGASPAGEPNAAEEGLRLLVEAAEGDGGLEQEEREMIHGIFELSQRPVREIMVPRIDIVAMDRSASVREVLDKITATGHSRIPIYDGSVDNVVGVLYAKDLLKYLRTGSQDSLAEPLARQVSFVPETKKIDELLRDMQQRKVHMAIVVDEYGGTAGLITIEDMLEEIVGEIRDEYDVEEEALFERVSDREAIFDARMNLRDVGEVLNIDLEGELEEHESDTLGGLVYERLGKVPAAGDEIKVNGCVISVLSTQGHRIGKVRVTLAGEPEAAGGEAFG